MIGKYKYDFFTTNELKPTGWIKKQLEIQAAGLCGNLDKVWPDVSDSLWIGGKHEGWERVPYWLDGFIPMAFLLERDDLKVRAKKYIDAIIGFQNEDGWICPCSPEERENYDTWAVLLITKVLCLYADCSGDRSVLTSALNCLKQFNQHLNSNTLRNWGAARWFEGLIAIIHLYEETEEEWLLSLAKKIKIQGFNWKEIFDLNLLEDCTVGWDYYSHIVNIAMMIKSEALWSLFDDGDPEMFAEMAISYLEEKHGMVTGHFSGDENLSGNLPTQGAELCSIVELMYSYEIIFAVTGNIKWIDRLEKLAYNSLPAAFSTDMWCHQYLQMINQVACYPMEKQPFRTNSNDAHIFGLEPNYGCCTANFGQGFPKLTLTSFMKSENSIASCAFVPTCVHTTINGIPVTCELITEYPFRDCLTYKITSQESVAFTLSLRIPSFVKSAKVDGKSVPIGEFYNISRTWNGTSVVEVEFEYDIKIVNRPNDMVCVTRGPLIYSIPIKEKWEKVEYVEDGVERKYPYCDYYVYPQSEWEFALADENFSIKYNDYDMPFNSQKAPIELTSTFYKIHWGFNDGRCDEKPNVESHGEKKEVTLIPYGCTNLRITEFPFI